MSLAASCPWFWQEEDQASGLLNPILGQDCRSQDASHLWALSLNTLMVVLCCPGVRVTNEIFIFSPVDPVLHCVTTATHLILMPYDLLNGTNLPVLFHSLFWNT